MPDLSQLPLRDIHLPEPVSWWPPAPGWWVLAALLVAGLAVLWLHHHRRRHQRLALKALRRLALALERGAEPVSCLQQVSSVLRRCAITLASDRSTVAGLTGRRWLEYLDAQWDRDAFRSGSGEMLVDAPYARPATIDRERAAALIALCIDWIKAQRIAAATHAALAAEAGPARRIALRQRLATMPMLRAWVGAAPASHGLRARTARLGNVASRS